jgi:hypothetical protein
LSQFVTYRRAAMTLSRPVIHDTGLPGVLALGTVERNCPFWKRRSTRNQTPRKRHSAGRSRRARRA